MTHDTQRTPLCTERRFAVPIEQVLQHFGYDHLSSEHLQAVSRDFHDLAYDLALRFTGPEVTVGLRKLLEAKDCMVRAARTQDG